MTTAATQRKQRRRANGGITCDDERPLIHALENLTTHDGGGITGQSGACMLGIARALIKFDSETFDPLRHNHLLTRDSLV